MEAKKLGFSDIVGRGQVYQSPLLDHAAVKKCIEKFARNDKHPTGNIGKSAPERQQNEAEASSEHH